MRIVRIPATPVSAPQWQCWRRVAGSDGRLYYEMLASASALGDLLDRVHVWRCEQARRAVRPWH